MSIKQELEKLKAPDLWSLMLFVLYKVRDIPEYSSLSELAYVLDEKNMLRLCEYFGGTTITIPTIDEMEKVIYGLLLYYYVEFEHMTFDDALLLVSRNEADTLSIKSSYSKIRETLKNYDFTSRAREE